MELEECNVKLVTSGEEILSQLGEVLL